jgi:drug/metabolite transporter (DMT)-like permease
MYIPILFGTFLQQFRYFYISDKLDHHEYLFLNSLLIASISSIYLVFLFVFEKTNIEKIVRKYRSLSSTELLIMLVLSILTVISGIIIYEIYKNINSQFINSIYFKLIMALIIANIAILLYNESYKIHQYFGIAMILFGLFLTFSSKII